MRLTGFIACGIVAHDCAEKALGNQPQALFSGDAVWVWWIAALFWVTYAIKFILE